MHLFFLHEVSYLKKPIYEMHEFPERLNLLGHRVSFMQFDEGFNRFRDARLPMRESIEGRVYKDADITLLTPWQLGFRRLDRLFATLITPFDLAFRLIRDKPDVFISYSVPTSGWQALFLCKVLGIPYVYRALDVSHRIRRSRLNWLVKVFERIIYRSADIVSVNNPAMATYASQIMGSERPIKFDPPPLDLSFASLPSVKQRSEVRARLGLGKSDKVLLYLGSFFYFSGLIEFLDHFSKTLRENKNFKFVLVGGGEQEQELRSMVESEGLSDQVIFTGFVPFDEIWAIIGSVDLALNPMKPQAVSHFALPNKVIQYLAMGTRVVSTRLKGLEALFDGSPNIVFENDYAQMARVAESLLSAKATRTVPGVINMFEADRATESFESTLVAAAGSKELG